MELWRTVFAALAFLGVADPAPPATAPFNLAVNSQWEIWSGVGHAAQQNRQGTGPEAPIASTGYTGGRTATFAVATTGDLSVGDLVTVSGASVDRALTLMPMRITALAVNSSVTVGVPLGKSPASARSAAATLVPTGIGGSWYSSNPTGDGPDGWARFPFGTASGPILWREAGRGNHAVNMPKTVSPYALLGARLQQAGDNYFYADRTQDISRFSGRTVSFGVYVMQKVKSGSNSYKVYFNESTNGLKYCSPSSSAIGEWVWVECSYAIPANPTYLFAGIHMNGAIGDVYYFCDPVLTIGSEIGGVQNYIKPPNEILIPKVHITPLGPWNGAIDAGTVTFPTTTTVKGDVGNWFGFYHDPFAETGGQVAPTVAHIWGQLEGLNAGAVQTGTAHVRGMMWYNRSAATPPGQAGSFLAQYAANVKSFTNMNMPLNRDFSSYDLRGTGIFQSGMAGDTWTNVALEYDMFLLN